MVTSERSPEDRYHLAMGLRPQMEKASSFSEHGKKIVGYRRSFSTGKELSSRTIASSSRRLHEIIDEVKLTTVTFGLNKTQFIEPNNWSNINKEDLWWSREELKHRRARAKELVAGNDVTIHDYLSAYNNSYCMVKKDRKMTSDCLKALVEGLRKGHRGLEDCVERPGFARTSANIHSHVTAVVKHYHDCYRKEGHKGGIHRQASSRRLATLLRVDSVRSISSVDSSQSSQPNIARSVRSFSAQRSAGNRHFAQSMGRAECLAASSSRC